MGRNGRGTDRFEKLCAGKGPKSLRTGDER
jgi:hypothetical protein